jgi:trans-AT polyketide synthase/acyltransferase/oxidoreductase domain-containing protein
LDVNSNTFEASAREPLSGEVSCLPMPTITSWATWTGSGAPAFDAGDIARAVRRFRETAHVVRESDQGRVGLAFGGQVSAGSGSGGYPLVATLPPLYPEWLGDRSFGEVHGVRFPYVTGAMANGIATSRLVIAVARAGLLGFFGAAGLAPDRVEKALVEIEEALGPDGTGWGSNLIHSPNEPDLEMAVADLYLRRGVRRVSASAYMNLTPAIVRYAATGLSLDPDGRLRRRHHVLAKVSRPEVAERFLSPAPAGILESLVSQGRLSRPEATLAARVPLAEDVTVESDSGGHTDNRPLAALFPTICRLRDDLVTRHDYERPIRVGAAGSLGTPAAVAAAFSLGAAYVLTGSVNQAAVESGLSEPGRRMLAEAGIADVVMAPAADMFELGVKLQVLRRGTLFAQRATRLYELYTRHEALESIPEPDRERLEREILGQSLEETWAQTRSFWNGRDPKQLERAEREPRHRMALVFRWYLGKSSRWAIEGDETRRLDFQIWCGPAMGAFNAWTRDSFLADPARREAVQIALNLLEGAAVVTRAQQLRSYGAAVPAAAFDFRPRPLIASGDAPS